MLLEWFLHGHGWQFLLGMLLAYYCLSPRLRGFTGRSIRWLLTGKVKAKHTARVRLIPPIRVNSKAIELGADKGKVVVEDGEVESWLRDNPDLRRVNGV